MGDVVFSVAPFDYGLTRISHYIDRARFVVPRQVLYKVIETFLVSSTANCIMNL